MKIRKAFKKLICMTCAALMAVTMIPSQPAKAALPSYYKYTASLDMVGASRVINTGSVATQYIPNNGVQYIGGWVLSTLPIQSYNILFSANGKCIKSVNSSKKPKANVYPYFKQYNWGFNGAESSFGKADGVTYSTTNSGWCFKIDAKDLPATCTAKVTGTVIFNGKKETVNIAEVTLIKSNYDTLEKYLKSIGKTVYSATSADVLNYFKNKNCDTNYLKYLNRCDVDTKFASNYEDDYKKEKDLYLFLQKYAKKLDEKCDVNLSIIFDTLYIHTCFEQLAYGHSSDDVVKGVTDAFDRIATLSGPFKQVITNHTTIMKAEYALIKARIDQIQTAEFMKDAYADFDAELAAEIYLYALSLPANKNEVDLLHVVNGISDYKVKQKYNYVINNKPEIGTKYKFKKITKKQAEKLFLFNLQYLVDPDNSWGYLN